MNLSLFAYPVSGGVGVIASITHIALESPDEVMFCLLLPCIITTPQNDWLMLFCLFCAATLAFSRRLSETDFLWLYRIKLESKIISRPFSRLPVWDKPCLSYKSDTCFVASTKTVCKPRLKPMHPDSHMCNNSQLLAFHCIF